MVRALRVADLQSTEEIYAGYHERGFEILGMNADPGVEKPKQLVAKLGLSWPEGKPSHELVAERFHITYWPMAVLLDAHRHILSRDPAKVYGPDLAKTLDQLLPAQR